jgi:patatin-like phospholipase/acyl hydrolase
MAKYRILSLDGGGIRGIITAVWLKALEDRLGEGRRIGDFVDLVAGTSTGAILACAVTQRIPASKIIELYRNRGREIFPSQRWRFDRLLTEGLDKPKYPDTGLGTVLRDVFKSAKISEIAGPRLLVTTYNTLTRSSVVIKSHDPRYGHLPLWEVAKASASAPTYFPAHVTRLGESEVPLIDGGVVANNPTACAIAEGVRINSVPGKEGAALKDFVVVSLGTGQTTRPINKDEATSWGALKWVVPIIDVLFDGAAGATDYIAASIIPPERYFRFQVPLTKAYDDMDNADATNVNALIATAEDYLNKQEAAIGSIANLLA